MTFRRSLLPERLVAPALLIIPACSTLALVRMSFRAQMFVELVLLAAAVASSAMVAAWIRDLLRCRTRAVHLDMVLAEQLHRVDYHSRRLESLWKLATQCPPDDESFLRALLVESSSSIHPGPLFYGVISHVEAGDIVIDVNQQCDQIDGALAQGARLPLKQTLLSELARTGKTCSWADVHAEASIGGIPRVTTMPWRAFIGTSFRVGATVYFLTFTSECALIEPFVPDDHAYLELVASFCASRLQQRVQFDRLRHQSSHDPLTGLANRTAFRVAGMQALASGCDLALAVVDIDRFRELNAAVGHQTADALLVEVGAAIAGATAATDLVARIGGDTFGVLLRRVAGPADAERRVERIRAVFGTPFGTGDRDGTARVAVTASAGVAVAPWDGTGFDRLLAHADAAMHVAKEARRPFSALGVLCDGALPALL